MKEKGKNEKGVRKKEKIEGGKERNDSMNAWMDQWISEKEDI